MKFIVISDTHIGDEKSTLVTLKNNEPVLGRNYQKFKEIAGKDNDYLILLGDIIDFSVRDYYCAFQMAKTFFSAIKKDGIADAMIYIPGNHDFDLWHTVEYQTNIINPMLVDGGSKVREFRMSVPGVLDDRKDDPIKAFHLPTVTRKSGKQPYGGLFFDNITGVKKEEKTPFYFAYPNLYFVTKTGETILITHGQYFEAYWSIAAQWAPIILGSEKLGVSLPLDLKDLVALNFPLSQLACSGTGQAGKLTHVIREIQEEAKECDVRNIEKYLDRLDNEIDKRTRFGLKVWNEIITDTISNKIKDKLIQEIKKPRKFTLRDHEAVDFSEDVKDRMKEYFKSSLFEISDLNDDTGADIPVGVKSILFGHTHHPIGYGNQNPPVIKIDNPMLGKVKLYNTGGWLEKPDDSGNREKYGAEIFRYDSNTGLSSVRIDVI